MSFHSNQNVVQNMQEDYLLFYTIFKTDKRTKANPAHLYFRRYFHLAAYGSIRLCSDMS